MKAASLWHRLLAALLLAAVLLPLPQASAEDTPDLVVAGVADYTVHHAFMKAYPSMNVVLKDEYTLSTGKLVESLLSRDDSFDVMLLFTENHDIGTLIDKGFCRPLGDIAAVSAMMDTLYPAFRQAVEKDGIPYGLPVDVYVDPLAYDEGTFAAAGIAVPQTWEELVRLMTTWQQQPDELRETYQLTMTTDYRRWLLRCMIDAYVGHMQAADLPLTFETETFRQLIALHSTVTDANNLDEEDPAIDDLIPLLYSGVDLLNMRWSQYHPLSLRWPDGTCDPIRARLFVAFVNPSSKNTDAAFTYLAFMADHLSPTQRIKLMDAPHSPIEAPSFGALRAEWEAEAERLTLALQTCADENKRDLSRQLQDHEAGYADLLRNQYEISPEDITAYRALAGTLRVFSPSLIDDQGDDAGTYLDAVLDRYLDGSFATTNDFISALESKGTMILKERGV